MYFGIFIVNGDDSTFIFTFIFILHMYLKNQSPQFQTTI